MDDKVFSATDARRVGQLLPDEEADWGGAVPHRWAPV